MNTPPPRSSPRRNWLIALAALAAIAGIAVGSLWLPAPPAPPLSEATVAPATPTPPPTRPASTPLAPSATALPPTAEPAAPLLAVPPDDPLFHPWRISYAPDASTAELQALLDGYGGPLSSVRFQVGSRSQSFAETLYGLATLYSINPLLLIALAEHQSRVLTTAQPSAEQTNFAFGFRGEGGNRRGLYSQLRWASTQIRWATRDYAQARGGPLPKLKFADGEEVEVNPEIAFSRYVLARVLAPTTTPAVLSAELDGLINTYARLFEDPRLAPRDWPQPAVPFMSRPMEELFEVTSFFDHDAPFLQKNGSITTYWGRSETDISFAYDGHTGWDFAMAPPDKILAAAAGLVTFAGNSDDGCGTPARAVIVEHGNGYRSLYWHLHSIEVELGQTVNQGDLLGVAGESGCAIGAHLHLQVQYLGRDVDPFGWCSPNPDPWAASPAGHPSVWLWADMPPPCGEPPDGMIVVDDADPGFLTSGEWQQVDAGYGGDSSFAGTLLGPVKPYPFLTRDLRRPAVAVWQPELPQAGRYRVLAYIPYALNGLDDTQLMRFVVQHSGGETAVETNAENDRNWWVDLGTYEFDPALRPYVATSGLAGDRGRGVWADAVAWIPVEE